MPDLLFPLPAAETLGLMKYFGVLGARIANTFSFATCGASLLSVNDCCMYRLFVFYQMDKTLEKFIGIPGFLLCVFAHAVIILTAGGYSIFFSANYSELQAYAARHNLSHLIVNLNADSPVVALDVDQPISITFLALVGLYLFVTETANIGLNFAVKKKIDAAKSSMSAETFKMQKSMTKVLLTQTIFPGISIIAPVMMVMVTIFLDKIQYMDNIIVQLFIVLAVGSYPLVNSMFCFYFIKPYRNFCKKLLFWKKTNVESVIVISEPSGTSFTQSP